MFVTHHVLEKMGKVRHRVVIDYLSKQGLALKVTLDDYGQLLQWGFPFQSDDLKLSS